MKYQKLRDFVKPLTEFSLRNRWILTLLDFAVSLFCLVVVVLLHNHSYAENIFLVDFFKMAVVYLSTVFLGSILCRTCRGLVRHLQFKTIGKLGIYTFLPSFVLYISYLLPIYDLRIQSVYILLLFLFNLVMVLYVRYWLIFIYNFANIVPAPAVRQKQTFVYGIGEHSFAIVQWLSRSTKRNYNIVGYVSRLNGVRNTTIDNVRVYDLSTPDIMNVMMEKDVSVVIFPDYNAVKTEQGFLTACVEKGITVLVAPPFEDVQNPDKLNIQMKPIQFEDLLGRDEIVIDMRVINEQMNGKVILVTGAAGSIGSELVRQISAFNPSKVVLFDCAETPLHDLKLELIEKFPRLKFIAIIGDVRNHNRLNHVFNMYKPQIVFHAAAYKHVPMMETNPCEAILTNVNGTRNVADYALMYNVERFVMISTDKAVNPTNIMGATKRVSEIYIQSLSENALKCGKKTIFVTTRFGNVLGSNGSVIPHFKKQIEAGGPVTVTHPDIIRYFMTIPEACRLVLEAGSFGNSGEVYVFNMGQPVKIVELAHRMIEMAGLVPDKDIMIEFTGLREGEKLFEELLTNKETSLPTKNDKILIASVPKYDYESVNVSVNEMIKFAVNVNVPATVKEMKRLVPEFKSNNSPFAVFDVNKVSF